MKNPAQELINRGQSVWYDNISREILYSGELKRLIEEWGVRGITSNPTIFDKALAEGTSYDGQILSLTSKNVSPDQVFEELALVDIAAAADLLLPLYRESAGNDGFVSIEVSPLLARDTDATLEEASRLFSRLARPNIMVKIPGTPEGLPAVRQALERGINVNITLLFSVQNYVQVAGIYCEALRARLNKNLPVNAIRSVASFFVSRVDTIVDTALNKVIAEKEKTEPQKAEAARSLIGQFGIVNSKLAYREFQKIFISGAFEDLRRAGAAVQRPLWASTSTKNPKYRDVIYVEELIGPHTVNTMPHSTLQAFVDHGRIEETLTKNVEQADEIVKRLEALGIDTNKLMDALQVEGVEKFSDSFRALGKTLQRKINEAGAD